MPTRQQAVHTGAVESGTTLTRSITVGSGSDRSLVAVVKYHSLTHGSGGPTNCDSVAFNTSESFTLRKKAQHLYAGNGRNVTVEIWTLDNPTTTTANVVATLDNAVDEVAELSVLEYTDANNGVGTNTQEDGGNNSDLTCTFTTDASDSVIIMGTLDLRGAQDHAAGTGTTEVQDDELLPLGGDYRSGVWEEAASGGSDTIDCTWSTAARASAAAIELLAAAAAAGLSVSEEEAVTVSDVDTVTVETVRITASEFESVTVADDDRVGLGLGIRPSDTVTLSDVDTVTVNEAGITYDAYSESGGDTGDHSWTHTPVGDPAGVIVAIVQNDSATDQLTGTDPVKYGTLALTRIRFDAHAGGEPGGVYLYWAGSSIPTGAQTITVTKDAAEAARCSAWTVTAGSDIEVDTSNGADGVADDPSVVLTTSAGVTTFIVSGLMSGQGAASNVQAGADFTLHMNNDAGGQTRHSQRRTTNATGGNVTVDFVTDDSDNYAIAAAALRVGAPTGLTVNVSDSVTVVDEDTIVLDPLVVSESETVTSADDIRFGFNLGTRPSDSVAVADDDAVEVAEGALSIDAAETVTAADDIRFGFNLGTRPADTVALSDVDTVVLEPLVVSEAESVTVTDVDTAEVTGAADLEISASDAVAVVDDDRVGVNLGISEEDAVSASDAETVALDPLLVSEAESVTVSDADTVTVAGGAPLTVSESEAVSAADQSQVVVTPLTVSAAESISAADVATVVRATVRITVDVSEAITLADTETAVVDPLLVEAQEALAVAEAVTMDGLAIPTPAILYAQNVSLTASRVNQPVTASRQNRSRVAVRRNVAIVE